MVTDCILREGKCNRGQQRVKWANDIRKLTGMRWLQLTQNWVNWGREREEYLMRKGGEVGWQ